MAAEARLEYQVPDPGVRKDEAVPAVAAEQDLLAPDLDARVTVKQRSERTLGVLK